MKIKFNQNCQAQIVIFLVFLLATLLAFMGGIISVGNKSLRNLRMQNAADAAALAGTACLARGLNSAADLTAAKAKKQAGGQTLVYPFSYPTKVTNPNAPVVVYLQPIGGLPTEYKQKELIFDPLPAPEYPSIINEGESGWTMAKQLTQRQVKAGVINEHLILIKNAIDATKKKYVDVDEGVINAAKKFALENGYEISEIRPMPIDEDTWQPTWEEKIINTRYRYWEEPGESGKKDGCGKCTCQFCACIPRGKCGKKNKKTRYYCNRCWIKGEASVDKLFWSEGTLHSTKVNVKVQLSDGTEREARGEVANIYSGSNPTGGQLFPPQSNFEIQLSE